MIKMSACVLLLAAAGVSLAGALKEQGKGSPKESFSNVQDYGAVGDGKSDDTTAIQAALAVGGEHFVYFPPGAYLVDGGLELLEGTTVYLAHGCEIRLKDFASSTEVFRSTASNVAIIGEGTVNVNGASQSYSYLKGVLLGAPSNGRMVHNVRVEGITIQDATYGGIRISQASDVNVDGVTLKVSDSPPERPFVTGIYVSGTADYGPNNVTISNCHLIGNADSRDCGDGIVFSYVSNGLIAENTIQHWGRTWNNPAYVSYGIDIEHPGDSVTITGNSIEDSNSCGIAGKGNGVVITDNRIEIDIGHTGAEKASTHSDIIGIYLADTDRYTVAGNAVRFLNRSGGNGIRLGTTSTSGAIVRNWIFNPADRSNFAAIEIYGAKDGVAIVDNYLIGQGSYSNACYGILCRPASDASSAHLLYIRDNIIAGFDAGWSINGTDLAYCSEITGNLLCNGYRGINLVTLATNDMYHVRLADNTLRDFRSYGIRIASSTCFNTQVLGNLCEYVAVPLDDAGTSTYVDALICRGFEDPNTVFIDDMTVIQPQVRVLSYGDQATAQCAASATWDIVPASDLNGLDAVSGWGW